VPPTCRPARVLVVDDEPDLRELVAFRLSSDGYEVTELASGVELLRTLRRADAPGDFDIVVMDVRMPQLSGIDALASLRASGCALPVILMSGSPDAATGARALALDAPLLAKPFELRDLSARVGELLARAERPEEKATR
jgi:DNA-binding response OmpR family regulator